MVRLQSGVPSASVDGSHDAEARRRRADALEQQLLFELLGAVAGKALLDVGCGDGALASELARRGAIVTGLDADPAMIAAARRRTEIEATQLRLIEGQAERLPFNDATFDCALAVTVLCFVRDGERAVAEMARSASRTKQSTVTARAQSKVASLNGSLSACPSMSRS